MEFKLKYKSIRSTEYGVMYLHIDTRGSRRIKSSASRSFSVVLIPALLIRSGANHRPDVVSIFIEGQQRISPYSSSSEMHFQETL